MPLIRQDFYSALYVAAKEEQAYIGYDPIVLTRWLLARFQSVCYASIFSLFKSVFQIL